MSLKSDQLEILLGVYTGIYPCTSQFYYIQVECEGVFVTRTCFHDAILVNFHSMCDRIPLVDIKQIFIENMIYVLNNQDSAGHTSDMAIATGPTRFHKCSLCDEQHAGTSCSRFPQQGNSGVGQRNQGKPVKSSPDSANTNKVKILRSVLWGLFPKRA